jgi:hypothetical protein
MSLASWNDAGTDALLLIQLSERGATKGRKDENAFCNSGFVSPAYQHRHRFGPEAAI